MAGYSLELPTLQNWSCHSCSGCCRQHGIAITDAEHARLVAQNWTPADGIPAEQPLFVRMGGWLRKRWWRLAHQPDGRCVFLDDRGLCRIHAKFGEPAKPLACQLYPYVFHPKGKQVVVSLRYSCPSVVRNQGRTLAQQSKELRDLARQVVPDKVTQARPPRLNDRYAPEWRDILTVVQQLETTLASEDGSVVHRVLRALTWIELLDNAQLDAIGGERLRELVEILDGAATAEVPANFDLSCLASPGKMGQMLFRLLAGQYGRIDSYTAENGRLTARWRMLTSAIKLARGRGSLPSLDPRLRPVSFDALNQPRGGLPIEADEILTRYFRTKLQGMHFCGRAYYGVPLIEGFRSLALVLPVTLWLARWLSVSRGASGLSSDDVADALAMADHHHGYSPVLGTFGARGRLRTLQRLGDIPRLVAWYGRGTAAIEFDAPSTVGSPLTTAAVLGPDHDA
ncbi:MAG: YkgJ family cysteine cluster protein [Planctomycetaceae bacterium]